MATIEYYRGGNSLKPRPRDLVFNRATGLLRTDRGISVSTSADNARRFGGAYRVTNVPPDLHFVQVGRNPAHDEIAPVRAMAQAEYEQLLDQIILVPA